MAEDKDSAREAKHGQKMIEIRVRFWTDGIAKGGKVLPKNAHTSGMVYLQANPAHDLKPKKARPFNSLLKMVSVIEKVLIENEIVLHPSGSMKKYLAKSK